MQDIGLSENDLAQINHVFKQVTAIKEVILYGSRAKGNYRKGSDVDLVIVGLQTDLHAQAVADELDELPLPYKFDVQALEQVTYQPLRDHIDRAGIVLYRKEQEALHG